MGLLYDPVLHSLLTKGDCKVYCLATRIESSNGLFEWTVIFHGTPFGAPCCLGKDRDWGIPVGFGG